MRGVFWWFDRIGRFANYHVPDGDTLEQQIEFIRQERAEEATTDIYDLLMEMEACFKESEHHWTGEGPITRPVVAMRRLVAELARRQLK